MLSPSTIHAGDTSFASSHIDVDAMEEALEERLGKEFVGQLLEDDTVPRHPKIRKERKSMP